MTVGIRSTVAIRLALQTLDHPHLCLSSLQWILGILLLIRLFVHLLWTPRFLHLEPFALSGTHLSSALDMFHYPLPSYLILNLRFQNHHTANSTPIHYGGPVSFVRPQAVVAGNPSIHLLKLVCGYLGTRHHTKSKWNERSKKNVVVVKILLCGMEVRVNPLPAPSY